VPTTGAVIKRWHTRIRNVFDVPFVYSYGIWVLRDDALEALSAEERKAMRDQISAVCRDLGAAIRGRNDKAREVLNRYGVTFIAPSAEMDEQWRKWAGALRGHLDAERQPSPDIQEALDKRLESCR
jgi:TRAP-type C4-dicarboxylate transport system substrate-binding protein